MKEPEPPPEPSQPTPTYRPDAFNAKSMNHAKSIVLTPECGMSTEERWEKETRYLIDDIASLGVIQPTSCVLDYGCGVGRLAKSLIERFGCQVVGVDISRSMRDLSLEYVSSDRFVARSPKDLEIMVADGFRVDFCVCVWVLQHVLRPTQVIGALGSALLPGGVLYAVNQVKRCVPTDQGWFADNFDIGEALRQEFVEEKLCSLPPGVTARPDTSTIMIQILRKPAG